MTRRRIAALAVCLVAGSAGSRAAAEDVNETKPAPRDGTVRIENASGSIIVKGWDRDEVSVEGTLGEGTERLDFEVTGTRTTVKVVYPRRARNVEESDITVQVPAKSTVEVSSVSATIDISGVEGETEAKSVSGDVTVEGTLPGLSASTVSGGIRLTCAASEIDVESVSGEIEITGNSPVIDGSTVSGGIDVHGETFKRISLESVSGSIGFEGALDPAGRFEFESHSGEIELALAGNVDADVEASTFSGSIESDFGNGPQRKSRYAPGEELHVTVGNGSANVSVTSFSGSVDIRRAGGVH